MAATISEPIRHLKRACPASVLLIGSGPLSAELERFFSSSHWSLDFAPSLAVAIRRLAVERYTAVLCTTEDWRRTAAAVEQLPHPPIVIALSESGTESGVQAIAKDVYSFDLQRLSAPELFSFLNHAWRIRNEER